MYVRFRKLVDRFGICIYCEPINRKCYITHCVVIFFMLSSNFKSMLLYNIFGKNPGVVKDNICVPHQHPARIRKKMTLLDSIRFNISRCFTNLSMFYYLSTTIHNALLMSHRFKPRQFLFLSIINNSLKFLVPWSTFISCFTFCITINLALNFVQLI